jgi:hypothetical protein
MRIVYELSRSGSKKIPRIDKGTCRGIYLMLGRRSTETNTEKMKVSGTGCQNLFLTRPQQRRTKWSPRLGRIHITVSSFCLPPDRTRSKLSVVRVRPSDRSVPSVFHWEGETRSTQTRLSPDSLTLIVRTDGRDRHPEHTHQERLVPNTNLRSCSPAVVANRKLLIIK